MNDPHPPPKFDDIIPYFYVALEETRRLVILSQDDEDEEKKEKVSSALSSEKDENDKEAPATKPKISRNADKLAQNLGHVHLIFQDLQKAAFDHRQQKKQPNNDSNANEINNNNDNVHDAIIQDCLNKLTKLSCAVLTHVTGGMKLSFHEDLTNNINRTVDNNKNSVVVVPDEDQAAVAHIVELVILFHVISNSFNHSHENRNTYEERIYEIIELYSSYQRKVLRQRSKPYIAYLVQLRQTPGYFLTQHHHQLKRNHNDEDDDDEEGEIDPELERQQNQPHTYTITFILGQASQLLQPLGAWIDSLPFDFEHLVSLLQKFDSSTSLQEEKKEGGMMIGMPFYLLYLSYSTMKILHEEAQKLTSTILTWLDEDRKISSDWIDKSILHYRRQQQQSVSTESSLQGVNVSGLEDICNELSFLCQVLARYMQFTSSLLPDFSSPPVIVNKAETATSSCFDFSTISCHLSQYCGNYASLEEFYASVSLLKAITIASAVPILTGEKVFVPSIVEDSFYISQRALERAHETMSSQAIITVIHRIVEMWECKTEEEILQEQYNKEQQHSQQQNTAVAIGVYKALMSNGGLLLDVCEAEMEADTGRTKKEEEMILQQQQQQKQQEKAKQALNSENDGDFTNAFLDAIDQDIGPSPSENNNNNINDTSTDENSSTIALSSLSLSTLTKAPTSLLHSTFSMLSSTSVSSSNHSSTNNNNLNSSSHFAQIMNTGKNNNNRKQKLDSGLQGLFSQICLLNGISSASSACAALSSFMDTFLTTTTHNENEYYDDDDEQNPQKGDNDTPEKKLFQLSQENLKSYSFNFSRLLSNMSTQMVTEWCGPSEFSDLKMIDRIQTYIEEQSYYIPTHADLMKQEELIQENITEDLLQNRFLRETILTTNRFETHVRLEIVKALTRILVNDAFLEVLLSRDHRKKFTDWGALLLSKQVRTVQDILCNSLLLSPRNNGSSSSSSDAGALTSSNHENDAENSAGVISTAPIFEIMEPLAKAVTILQLEKPSDWTNFKYNHNSPAKQNNGQNGSSNNSNNNSGNKGLSNEDVKHLMCCRVDFSLEAVEKACL